MKHADGAGAVERAGELAEGLAHESRLQADEAVAHLALDLGLGRERRDRVDGDDVEGAAAHQHLGDLEGLLAVVGLRDQEVVDVDADGLGVQRVHGVLGVDEGGLAAEALGLGDEVVHEGGLAGRLGAVDLDDAAARDAAHSERDVESERACRHALQVVAHRMVAHAHDAALAELALDLGHGCVEGLVLVQTGRSSHWDAGKTASGVWTAPPLCRRLLYKTIWSTPNPGKFTFCRGKG